MYVVNMDGVAIQFCLLQRASLNVHSIINECIAVAGSHVVSSHVSSREQILSRICSLDALHDG